MIHPKEIKIKAQRKYKNYLQAIINEENIFPLDIIGNKKPSNSISEFNKELKELILSSKEKKGFGYSISYNKRKTKILGTQSLPSSIYFETKHDFEKYLNIQKEVNQFKIDYQNILKHFPELLFWIEKYPNKVIDNSEKWSDILKVCEYFKANPKPNLFIRELPITLHTKFIEGNRAILKELLDIIINPFINKDKTKFEKRFNLKYSEPLIRFKILDSKISKHYFSGINDISIPINQFNAINLNFEKVIIVENKTNLHTIALTLPEMEKTIVIFGSGFKIENLKNATWLNKSEILYWGDLDVQGFEILSQMRNYFPKTKSFLMDETTFDKFFENDNGTLSNVNISLNLTEKEMIIYKKIKKNNWRLEQEKIPLEYVKKEINKN
ncbi:Wadjet anti-phage system protein JetD domain-containing protein [Tenacibaculum piscium]|uniref:Wadjet anti-phage system protein JetD domain-containing protein n=1 Tax=Tenacibaculum piscium TaxID=1458515 RepID=UPI001F2788AE|nr:Wadjet anti-phage system protein JetD domain-containing protein [Tenacibaculum piscium]